MGGCTRAVSGQRLRKRIPVARQQILNNATVGNNNERTVFSMWSVPRCYKEGTKSVDSSVQESVKRGLETGGRGIVIVGAVSRKRLLTD
jgi:hypothetical protein